MKDVGTVCDAAYEIVRLIEKLQKESSEDISACSEELFNIYSQEDSVENLENREKIIALQMEIDDRLGLLSLLMDCTQGYLEKLGRL